MTLEEHKCHISLKPTASLIQKPPLKLNCSRNSVRRGMWKSAWLSLESFTEEGTLEVQYEKLGKVLLRQTEGGSDIQFTRSCRHTGEVHLRKHKETHLECSRVKKWCGYGGKVTIEKLWKTLHVKGFSYKQWGTSQEVWEDKRHDQIYDSEKSF